MTDTPFVPLCSACAHGDCWGHVHEFIGPGNRIYACRCPDPDHQHGKLRTEKEKCFHCGHPQHMHKRQANGGYACASFGCGCRDF